MNDEHFNFLIMADGARYATVIAEAIERLSVCNEKQVSRSIKEDRLIATTWLKRKDFRPSKRIWEFLKNHDDQ
jgi:hypothetical protein